MFDCSDIRYNKLYARWLERGCGGGNLLDHACWKPGERLLDLCGGTGLVSFEAMSRGAPPYSVDLLDLNPYRNSSPQHIMRFKGRAEDAVRIIGKTKDYDVVVIRQAIGYLDLEKVFSQVLQLLKPGGRFVFNTFQRPRWGAQIYIHEGHRYFEASGHLFGHVGHIQARGDVGVDFTTFRWYSPEEITMALSSYFCCIEGKDEVKSTYYRCKA